MLIWRLKMRKWYARRALSLSRHYGRLLVAIRAVRGSGRQLRLPFSGS